MCLAFAVTNCGMSLAFAVTTCSPSKTVYAEVSTLSLQGSKNKQDQQDSTVYRTSEQTDNGKPSSSGQNQSIHGMTTNEWRDAYEEEGCVDLWVEEEFNSGSRLMVSSAGPSIAAFDFTVLLLQT